MSNSSAVMGVAVYTVHSMSVDRGKEKMVKE